MGKQPHMQALAGPCMYGAVYSAAPVVGAGRAAGDEVQQTRHSGGGASTQNQLSFSPQAAHQRLDDGVKLRRQRPARHCCACQAACNRRL